MGNCLTGDKVLPPAGCRQAEVIKETGYVTASNLEGAAEVADGVEIKTTTTSKKKNKVVRFKLNEENYVDRGKQGGGELKNGVVRIRLVVTQKELKQILSSRKDLKHSSMEQLIRVMELRGTRFSEDGRTSDDGFHGGWRPALESIPEEH